MNAELLGYGLLFLLAITAGAILLPPLIARRERPPALTLPLALLTSNGVLLASGGVELAGRYGQGALLALMAFTLIYIFAPLVLYPFRRLTQITSFATVIDFIAFRYRGNNVARISAAAMTLCCLPLLLAQFIALSPLAVFFLGEYSVAVMPLVATAICITSWRMVRANNPGRQRNLLAYTGIILLIALTAATAVAVSEAFGSWAALNRWAELSGQEQVIKRLESGYLLMGLFLAASIALPINFNFAISQRLTKKQIGEAGWGYPLLMLLIALPLFPLLWSGLASRSEHALQEYLYALPMAAGSPPIAAFAAVTVILVALSCCCSLSLSLARIIVNGVLLPKLPLKRENDPQRWINQRTAAISIALVIASALLSTLFHNQSVIDYYIVGFAGLAQFSPGLLAACYVEKFSRKAFLAGLLSGLSLWFVTLLLPLVFGSWSWSLPHGVELVFGMPNWTTLTLEASLLNLAVATMVTRYSRITDQERPFATLCMLDNVYIPARVELHYSSIPEIRARLAKYAGNGGLTHLNDVLTALALPENEARPAALRKLRLELFRALGQSYGYLTTSKLMEKALPIKRSSQQGSEDINQIESVFSVQNERMGGIASELNRLRIYQGELLNSLPVGVISVSASGEILRWNRAMANYSGITASSAVGGNSHNLAAPWGELLQTIIHSSDNEQDNQQLKFGDNLHWFNWHKALVTNGDSDELLIVLEDNTRAMSLTQRHISRDRLTSVGRLAAGVAHEIGNPVTGISCLAQDLNYSSDDSEVKTTATQILSQTERISRIVQALVNFSKGERAISQSNRPTSIARASLEAEQLLSMSPGKEIEFSNTISETLTICGDHHQLVQVFINLLSNARDASPENGTITLHATADNQQITIEVSDQGCGVDSEALERIYEPFYTSKEPGSGTGLGLWIVYNLIKNLNGEIRMLSPAVNSDCGTTVRLIFPQPETAD